MVRTNTGLLSLVDTFQVQYILRICRHRHCCRCRGDGQASSRRCRGDCQPSWLWLLRRWPAVIAVAVEGTEVYIPHMVQIFIPRSSPVQSTLGNSDIDFLTRTPPINTFGTSGRRCSRSPFRRSTGNDVSGHYFNHYFLSFFPFFCFFLRLHLFS